jgi:DNA-binding NtrC family response regulator
MAYALLIDDDVALVDSIKRTTDLAGLELLTAISWDEGLNMFYVYSPDLVIADYNLPGSRHGIQLLDQIRRLRPSVRVLLLSAYIDESDIVEIEALGIVDRAISKVSSDDPMGVILDEIESAANRATNPTDWKAVAAAYRRVGSIDSDDLDDLDHRLQARRGIS